MATAITPLANVTLASNTATVTFSSISQSYRDLRLVITGYLSTTASPAIRLNGDTTVGNYIAIAAYGNGASATSNKTSAYSTGSIGWWAAQPTVGTTFIISTDFMDYGQTDKHKTYLTRYAGSSEETGIVAGRWASTTAVTSILVTGVGGAGVWAAGTTMALYGISA